MNRNSPFLDRLGPAARRARAELEAWASPDLNPFLAQARRIDARGWRLPISLVFVVLFWISGMAIDFTWARERSITRDFANDGARLWIGLVWVISWFMARLRDSELLRAEVVKGRFEPIQLMPLSSTRRAWLWSAPNSLWGLLLSATLLPALFWCLGSALLSGREALLLIFFVALTQWSVPVWSPAMWRLQSKPATPKPTLNLKTMGAGGQTKNRLGDGFVLPPDLTVSARGWGGGGGLGIPFYLLMQTGIGGTIALAYWRGLPFYVRAATHELWFNWPIFLVRWLGEPQPFYGISLAPIWLLVGLWLAIATNRVLRLAAVTGREQFWTPARFKTWQRAQTAQGVLFFALLIGLLWPGAIAGDSWLANWFGLLAGTPSQALAAWWVIALGVGALAATAMWRAALEFPVGALTLRAQWPRALRLAARALAGALGFFAFSCVLGGRWPFGALWASIALPSLAVAAVWIGALGALWTGQRAPRFSKAWTIWHGLWLYAGPLGGAALLLAAGTPLAQVRVFFPLSPWTLWLMLRAPKVASNPIFWRALEVHAVLIVITGALAWLATRDEIVVPVAPGAELESVLDDIEQRPAAQPASAPALPGAVSMVNLSRRQLESPGPAVARLLSWLARFNNPLLLLEMRRAITPNLSQFVRGMLVLQGVIALVPLVVFPVTKAMTGFWPSDLFNTILVFMLVAYCFATLCGAGGASLVYDRDRMDGTLEMLFLTPRTESEIAWGKVGPFLVRALVMSLLFAPLYLVGVACLPTAGLPLLTAAYLAAPLWILALTARGIVTAHWLALRKREIGVSNFGFVPTLLIVLSSVAEIAALGFGFYLGPTFVVLVAGALALIYALEAVMLWRGGCATLTHQRAHGVPTAK